MGARAAGGRAFGAGRLVWRSLPLQAAFNPETLQGAGFAFAVLPVLERVHGAGAGARAAQLSAGFNANPYLAPVAVGAVAAAEGREAAERVDRFLQLVRAPLGSLGDALFWGAARPAIFVPAGLAVVAGAPWWVALVAVAAFNALAFAARFSGVRAGLASGVDVAARLGPSWIRRVPGLVRPVGAAAIGLLAGLVLGLALRGGASAAGGPAAPAGSAWLAAVVFAVGVPLFALWPRRVGWGSALLALWAAAAGLASWTLA